MRGLNVYGWKYHEGSHARERVLISLGFEVRSKLNKLGSGGSRTSAEEVGVKANASVQEFDEYWENSLRNRNCKVKCYAWCQLVENKIDPCRDKCCHPYLRKGLYKRPAIKYQLRPTAGLSFSIRKWLERLSRLLAEKTFFQRSYFSRFWFSTFQVEKHRIRNFFWQIFSAREN